ncbi:MAG: DUF2953 domain-containing protein [Firmicutes bacterium]|nr:DUF2953 domain-containing protein [Bacillota bacterium]
MKQVLLVLPFSLVLVLLIQLIPVRINLFFVRENKDDYFSLGLSTFFSLLRYKMEVPVIKQETPLDLTMETEIKSRGKLMREQQRKFSLRDLEWQKIKAQIDWFKKNKQILSLLFNFLRRATVVEKLNLDLCFSLEDAFLTGMAAGLIWSFAGILAVPAQKCLRLKNQPQLSVMPDFSGKMDLKLRLEADLSLRLGHLTVGGLLFFLTKLRGGK